MVSQLSSPEKLSPDGSGRFLMMLKLIQTLFNNQTKKTINILDVGGGSLYMSHILKKLQFAYDITTIDMLPKPRGLWGKYIQGDATQMDFPDKTFELVVSTDVLEHIPVEKKEKFVEECIRVAKDYVIIAAPFNTDHVDYAERLTNKFNKKLFNEGQNWLEEHFQNKKPELALIDSIVKKHKLTSQIIGTNNLYNWTLATHINLIEAKYGLVGKKIAKANEKLNETILVGGDMTGPFYRHFVVIFKTKPTTVQLEVIKGIKNQTINHESNLTYVHDLMELTSERLSELKEELTQTKECLVSANSEIKNLQHELSLKEAILERCAPYVRFINLTPQKLARKLLNPPKKR